MDINHIHSKMSALRRYLLAIGIFTVALGLRFLLLPVESEFAFVTFYPATVISFYLCGMGPGVLTTGASAIAAYYIFIPPYFQFAHNPGGEIALIIFLATAYLISCIVKRLQHTLSTLKESEQRYLAMLEDQTEFICRFKADGTILFVNDAFCRLFCRPRGTLIGNKWQPIAAHEDLPLIYQKLGTLSPANPVVTIENRFTAPGRGILWGQFVNRAFFNDAGQLLEIQAVGRNITAQKEAEIQLAKSLSLLSATLNSTNDAILVVDLNNTWALHNQQFIELWQIPDEIVASKNDEAALSYVLDQLADADGFLRKVHELYDTPEASSFDYIQFKNGKTIERYSMPQRIDNKVVGRVWSYRDITTRKQAEEQLLKLATAVEQSAESIIITNTEPEIEYVNNAFLRSTGYRQDEVMGQNPRFLKSGKTPQETYVALWDALTHGQCWKGELVNKFKDGSEHVEFATISPVRQANESITHYVDVMEDITEKKRIAEELDQHRHHLETLVASRTAELENALTLADAANQAKSAFLSNMSHEIRTPMNAIIGLTYLLKKSSLTADQSYKLLQIEESSQHLLTILNDILDLSKLEANRIELEHKDFALEDLLDYTRSLIVTQGSQQLSIEVDNGDVPRWLHGDLTRLRQALLNYANNAVKFTERGSIWLRAKLLAETDAILLVRFEVQDTGIGIEQDKLPILFEAFAQADTSLTRQYGGTGLGLTITQRLANLMGGTTGAESVLGQGSLFWFTARLQCGQGRE
ncbi:MAG: PAS domain S-box protein [Methylococcaceae bacterium]|nr:PAS domain S-box protein [Methylococcaceae bacterium]